MSPIIIKKLDLYFCKLTFVLEFDNNSLQSIETNYRLNTDNIYMKTCLLTCIEYFILRGYKICNNNQITINSINDRCNMTYEYYISQPMQAIELKLNMLLLKIHN